MKKLFLLDMDGTIYLGEQLFAGTAAFLKFVRESGGQYAFLTNNSSRGIEGYLAKMERMGIPQKPEYFLTSTDATIAYLKKRYPGCDAKAQNGTAQPATVFYACGTENFKSQLRAAGLTILTEDEAFAWLESNKACCAASTPCCAGTPVLLLGYDTELAYRKLEICVRLLGYGCDYIATHPDLVCPMEWGNAPDIGLVIHDLKVCTGREPVIIGKPQPQMVYTAMEKYGATPEETVLIGDRLYTDIACGNNAGIDTILVLSGEGTVADCEKYGVTPTYIYKDIAAVLADLKADGTLRNP